VDFSADQKWSKYGVVYMILDILAHESAHLTNDAHRESRRVCFRRIVCCSIARLVNAQV
jgi:hypothetical protein